MKVEVAEEVTDNNPEIVALVAVRSVRVVVPDCEEIVPDTFNEGTVREPEEMVMLPESRMMLPFIMPMLPDASVNPLLMVGSFNWLMRLVSAMLLVFWAVSVCVPDWRSPIRLIRFMSVLYRPSSMVRVSVSTLVSLVIWVMGWSTRSVMRVI